MSYQKIMVQFYCTHSFCELSHMDPCEIKLSKYCRLTYSEFKLYAYQNAWMFNKVSIFSLQIYDNSLSAIYLGDTTNSITCASSFNHIVRHIYVSTYRAAIENINVLRDVFTNVEHIIIC